MTVEAKRKPVKVEFSGSESGGFLLFDHIATQQKEWAKFTSGELHQTKAAEIQTLSVQPAQIQQRAAREFDALGEQSRGLKPLLEQARAGVQDVQSILESKSFRTRSYRIARVLSKPLAQRILPYETRMQELAALRSQKNDVEAKRRRVMKEAQTEIKSGEIQRQTAQVELDQLRKQWLFEDPDRVLSYALTQLSQDPQSREQLFASYIEQPATGSKEKLALIRSQFRDMFSGVVGVKWQDKSFLHPETLPTVEPSQNGEEQLSPEEKLWRESDSFYKWQQTQLEAGDGDGVESPVSAEQERNFKICRLERDVDDPRNRGWLRIKEESPDSFDRFIARVAKGLDKQYHGKGEVFLKMIDNLLKYGLTGGAEPEKFLKVRIGPVIHKAWVIRPSGIGISLEQSHAAHLRVVFTLVEMNGENTVVIKGIYDSHRSYDRAVKGRL